MVHSAKELKMRREVDELENMGLGTDALRPLFIVVLQLARMTAANSSC